MNADGTLHADPVLQLLIAEASADPDVIGLVLTGSRAIGATGPDSDYDVVFVVTDEALAQYTKTEVTPPRGTTVIPPISTKDIWHEAASSLQFDGVEPWMRPTWAEACILYDRTGETEPIFAPFRRMTEEQARVAVAGWYDDYLNGFFRSLKCWRRGNQLGGRMEAAQTADILMNLLFALESRWRPYSSRLIFHLHHLAGQGWRPAELQEILLDLISTGDPTRQQILMRRVAALLCARGFDHVYDDWGGQIDQALAWVFPEER
jgi:hypothetical protein